MNSSGPQSGTFMEMMEKIIRFIDSLLLDELIQIDNEIMNENLNTKIINGKEISTFFKNNKSKPHLKFEREIEIDNIDRSQNKNFIIKKGFYDVFTDNFSSNLIFNDDNQEKLFCFQYLINMSFKRIIELYYEKFHLEDNKIIFIFKGGTVMKIIYNKYQKLLKDPYNINILNKFVKYFKRSDSDYGIFIDKEIGKEEYNKHFVNFNKILYNMLIKFMFFINENINYFINKVVLTNEETMKKLLEELNIKLNSSTDKGMYADIDEFIGITIDDKHYFNEIIPQINYNNLKVFEDEMKDNDIEKTYTSMQLREFENNSKLLNSNKSNFYITFDMENNKLFQILYPLNKNNTPLFYYINETNFFNGGSPEDLTYFSLFRMKYNVISYFKTKDNKYGFLNTPSEIIDIPISNYNDSKIGSNFKKIFKEYNNKKEHYELLFNSYNLEGFIKDLITVIFKETKLKPWNDNKYEKRIQRLAFYYYIYILLSSETEEEFNNYKKTYNESIEKLLNNYELDHSVMNNELYGYLFQNLINVKRNIDMNETGKFNNILKILKINELFKYEDIYNELNIEP